MWDISTRTKTKLIILDKYLRAWTTILKIREPILYYIDGFAGPGWYNDPQSGAKIAGSPVRAIKIYEEHKEEKNWNYELRFINVEKVRKTFNELENATRRFKKKFYVKNLFGEFLDKIDEILKEIENHHTFFFIDPFGISGIDFDELANVFQRKKTEIFVNFQYNGLQRCLGDLEILDHEDKKVKNLAEKTIKRVSLMMGLNLKELRMLQEKAEVNPEKEREILRTYRSNLEKHKRFVYPFKNNFPGSERTFYYLIFMTDNITGLKIMKDIMYKERDKEMMQLFLFPKTDVSNLKDKLANFYKGQKIPYNRILEDWLPKCEHIDGEDYLKRDINKALKLLDVKKVQKLGYKQPLYIFP